MTAPATPPHAAGEAQIRPWLIGVIVVGVALRLALVATTVGSNDARLWELFAIFIEREGLLETYRILPHFNHPPAMAEFALLSHRIAEALGTSFQLVFRLPIALADVAAIGVILYLAPGGPRARQLATATFALAPIAIGVSSYHGNTDSLCALLTLAGVVALWRDRPLLAGLFLGAAINVKLIPLMLLPALALPLRDRKTLLRFLTGLAVWTLPFLPPLVATGMGFFQAVISYNSIPINWGMMSPGFENPERFPQLTAWLNDVYRPYARFGILGSSILLGLWARARHRHEPVVLSAIVMSTFLVLAPGFGVQYLVYPLGLLLLADLRFGFAYAAIGGLFITCIYLGFWDGTWPAYSNFKSPFPEPAASIGLLTWATLLCFVGWTLARLARWRMTPRT